MFQCFKVIFYILFANIHFHQKAFKQLSLGDIKADNVL